MKKILNRFTAEVIHEYDETEPIDFSGVDLTEANFSWSDLRGSKFREAKLTRANFISADLTGANLISADLIGADLRSADLRSADLRSADLLGANLRDADLTEANLSGANLEGADLTDVKGIKVLIIEQEPFNILCLKFSVFNQVQIGCEVRIWSDLLRYYKKTAKKYRWSDERVEKYLKHKTEMEEFFREGAAK